MSNVSKLSSLASRLEDIKYEMDNLLEEAKEIVRDAEKAGEEVGLHIYEPFKAYQYAHLKIRILGSEESGYMTRDEGLSEVIEAIKEARNELKNMEADNE